MKNDRTVSQHLKLKTLPIPMAKVEIYTWQYCPFCIRAKSLLNQKGVQYHEYTIDGDDHARNLMAQRPKDGGVYPRFLLTIVTLGGAMTSMN